MKKLCLICILLLAVILAAPAMQIVRNVAWWRVLSGIFVDPDQADSMLKYNFDNNSDPTTDDSASGVNSGTLGAGGAQPTWVAESPPTSAYYSFDGGDYITVANESNFDFNTNNPLSVMAWVYPHAANGYVVSKLQQGGKGWELFYGATDFYIVYQSGAGVRMRGSTAANSVPTGQWTHICWTYDGSALIGGANLYVNGTNFGIEVDDNALNASVLNNRAVLIGKRPDFAAALFNGFIDGVAIYTNKLTEPKVLALVNDQKGAHP